MGLNDVLNTARDALTAQTFGLTVAGQNVSNINTPGYVRRSALLETRDMGDRNYGSVNVAGLRRVADEFVDRRHLELTGGRSEAFARDQLLSSVEGVFDDVGGTGLAGDLSALLGSFSDLASAPDDMAVRGSLLSQADRFATRVNQVSDSLASVQQDLLVRARHTVTELNQQLKAVADITGRINRAQLAGKEPADLKDRRAAMLGELAEKVNITTFTDEQGQLNVRGAGVTLVQGDTARQLSIGVASDGALEVRADTLGPPGSDVTRFVTGGELSGILQVRDTDVAALRTQLDNFVFELASEVNARHSAGFGLDAAGGRNFFDVSAGATGAAASLAVSADVAGLPSHLAAAADPAGAPGDAGNALLLARLAETALPSGRTPTEEYARFVSEVGERKAQAERTLSTREAMEAQVESLRQSISGVSLDEEMISLTKFQRAFEASSRVLTTADQLLEDLINTLGR